MIWRKEAGAALLTTLIVVAALSAVSVAAIADMQRSHRISANAVSTAQAQWYAIGAEQYARLIARELASGSIPRTALAGPPRVATFPLDRGVMRVTVHDGSTCINLNSVVSGAGDVYERNSTGAAQLATMMELRGVPAGRASELVDSLVAWIDSRSGSADADDAPYAQVDPPYLTGREPLAELSEVRAIRGYSPEVLEKLRPWVCALPRVGPSIINLNALTPDQAPLVVAVSERRLTLDQARNLIRNRPAAGWQSLGEAFGSPELAGLNLPENVISSFALETSWVAMEIIVTHDDAEVVMSGLLARHGDDFVSTARRWTEDS